MVDVYKRKGLVVQEVINKVKVMKDQDTIERAVLYEIVLINGFNNKLFDEIIKHLQNLGMIQLIGNDLIKRVV